MKRVPGAVALLIWLILQMATLTAYPAVWVDEILSADAGIHLARGQGFVSAAWFNQPSWEFWASYTPLYAATLAGWLKLFGVSALTVRSFSLVLILISLGLIFRSTRSWWILAALAFSEPLVFLMHAARPDSVSVLLLCVTATVFQRKKSRWRLAAIFLCGLLAIPAALQYAAYVLILGALLQLWYRLFKKREAVCWLAGCACGGLTLCALYAYHGVLRIFLESTVASKHSSAGRWLQDLLLKNGLTAFRLGDILGAPFRDYATPVVLAGGAALWWMAKRAGKREAQKAAAFCVACATVIPLAIQLLGKYPIYYTYTALIPATVACFMAAERLGKRAVMLAAISLIALGGAGRIWWRGFAQGTQAVSVSEISPEDWVIADYPVYYPLLGRTRELFAAGYAGGKVLPQLPASQAARITKLFIRDSLFPEMQRKVGGLWKRQVEVAVVTIDDDTRHPAREAIAIYVRAGGNKKRSAAGAR